MERCFKFWKCLSASYSKTTLSNAQPFLRITQNNALDSLSFMLVSESFMLKQLKTLNINKAIGLGKISEAIIALSQVYCSCLERHLLNLSVIPSVGKNGKVTPFSHLVTALNAIITGP